MPNWANNTVQITGPKKKIQAIKRAIEADGFLDHLYPMPKELQDTENSSDTDKMSKQPTVNGHNNWYDWRVEQWGTKWEVTQDYAEPEVIDLGKGESRLNWSFDSAWAPPIGAYAHFLNNNEDISLKAYYYEGGCDFAGVWDNGADTCIAPGDYRSDDQYWQSGLGLELDEMFCFTESMAEYEEQEAESQKEDVTEYVKGRAMNTGETA